MQVYRGLREVPEDFGPSVASIGNFDGVHRGHQQILAAVVREARERDMLSMAVTFDPHPDCFLRPDEAPQLLTPMEYRLELLAATGVDAVVVLKFDAPLAKLGAREFAEWVLVDALGVRGLHEGGNFRFGNKAEAGVAELATLGSEFGFGVTVHRAVRVHGLEVSSSAVRMVVAAGDMKRARWMLGRPFTLRSTQKRDRGVGSKLLVPTINFAKSAGLLPKYGIYVTRLRVPDHGNESAPRCFQAVSSLGMRPTFAEAGFALETHILNFEPAEMDEETPLELEFLYRLRDEEKYASVDELKAQILRDVERAERYFKLASSF